MPWVSFTNTLLMHYTVILLYKLCVCAYVGMCVYSYVWRREANGKDGPQRIVHIICM